MSDYLWDKTGEADAEVERFEEMLGAFVINRPSGFPAEAGRRRRTPHSSAAPIPARAARRGCGAPADVLAGGSSCSAEPARTGPTRQSRDSKDAPTIKEAAAPREEFTPRVEPEKRVEQADTNNAPLKETVRRTFAGEFT